MCVENSRVHGSVISQPHTSHLGSCGRRAVMYQAKAASAAIDRRLSRTKGASGTGTMLRGTPTSSGLQSAGNLAFRPDDVRSEVGPGAGRVVAQTHQVDLRFVLEEELARQPEEKAECEEGREGDGRQHHAAPRGVRQCHVASLHSRRARGLSCRRSARKRRLSSSPALSTAGLFRYNCTDKSPGCTWKGACEQHGAEVGHAR